MSTAIIAPHATIGYYRNCRTHLIEVVLGMGRKATRTTVHPTIFLAVFPALDRRYTGGTISANPDQLYALGLGPEPQKRVPVKLADMPHQVRYFYAPHIGRIIARLLGTSQELSSNPRHFRKVTGVSSRAVLGSVSLTSEQARSLGFIIAGEVTVNDSIQSAHDLLPA